MENDQLFDPALLKESFARILGQLYELEESVPFRSISVSSGDVDEAPMDLSDIENRLNAGHYIDPWRFVEDMWVLFEDTWNYNRSSSKLYQYCTKLAEIYESKMDKCMRSLGLCCGRKFLFNPSPLECDINKCYIGLNSKYYELTYKKYLYTICAACFLNANGDSLKVKSETIPKCKFAKKKNDIITPEKFVECRKCGRRLHQICVLYFDPIENSEYTCEVCDPISEIRRMTQLTKYSADKLMSTKLSDWIQTRLDRFMKIKNIKYSGAVTVRVVSSSKKMACVKKEMRTRFSDTGRFPTGFPYTNKVIFVFQELDEVDVCLFAMYVQEYDSSCCEPNNRRVYISYLDSVNYFRPKELRTEFYYEIMLAYMEYIKTLGYKMVHVWACPPPDGDDYLFYRHPPSQKPPDHARLEQWYSKLLNEGISRGIILENTNVLPDSSCSSVIYKLPYFENDFWPNVLEDSLKKLDDKQIPNPVDEYSQLEKYLIDQLHLIHNEQKEVFFNFQLHSDDEVSSLLPIIDPDPLIKCELMEDRDSFLILSRDNNYEFSSIRRAKFSSLVLLYELHTNNYGNSISYSCNQCSENIVSGYHCPSCEDFDLCFNCWSKERHEHDMEYIPSKKEKPQVLEIESKPKPESEIKTDDGDNLLHSRLCKDRGCEIKGCARIKGLISHFTVCPVTSKTDCPVCKQLLTLCLHHAKFCRTKNCQVPSCERVKMKLMAR